MGRDNRYEMVFKYWFHFQNIFSHWFSLKSSCKILRQTCKRKISLDFNFFLVVQRNGLLHCLSFRWLRKFIIQIAYKIIIETQLNEIKVRLYPSKKNFFICFNDSPSTMMKNVFYFILKTLFVLKIFEFLSWLFGHVEKTAWLEGQG